MLKRKWHIFALIILTVLISYPAMFMDIALGHDLNFHLFRIEGLLNDASFSNFPVRIQSDWLDGYGYPVSILYGDLFMYVGALYRKLGFSVINSYRLFIVTVNAATVAISYNSFRIIFKNKTLGVLSAVLYTTAAYRLVDEYVRCAIGETLTIVFLPAVALSVYLIFTSPDRHSRFRASLILAFTISAITCAHTLTTSMLAFILIPVCIAGLFIFCEKGDRLVRFFSFAEAAIITVLLTAFFTVPLADYYLTSDIDFASSGDMSIQLFGLNFADLFAFFVNPFFFDINEIKIQKTPGIALMLVFICAIVYIAVSLVKRRRFSHHRRIIFETVCTLILLVMTMQIFPWNYIEYNVPLGKILTSIEYPMRYLAFAILFMSLLAGDLLEGLYEAAAGSGIKTKKLVITSTSVLICLFGVFNVANLCVYNSQYKYKAYYETQEDLGRWEYYAMDFLLDHTTINDLPLEIKTEGMVSFDMLSREHNDFLLSVTTGPEYGWIELPVFNYKYFYAHDVSDPEKVFEIHEGMNRTVGVLLPGNYSGIVHVYMKEPLWWRIANYTSLISFIACLSYLAVSVIFRSRFAGASNRSQEP